MIKSPMPTRAEVSDVATAVFDGADAVMLSAESASGDYPVEAVQTMDRIACAVEDDELYHSLIEAQRGPPERTTPDAIMAAVHEVTETIEARAIVCWTKSGITAMRAARERSSAPIIAPTPSIETARRLTLVWGTHSVTTEDIREVAYPVLRHRLMTTFNADAEGITTDELIRRLISAVPPPQEEAAARARRG